MSVDTNTVLQQILERQSTTPSKPTVRAPEVHTLPSVVKTVLENVPRMLVGEDRIR